MTVKEARDAGLIELTVPSDPNERIETQWGELTIFDWVLCERGRIARDPARRTGITHHDNGYLSLWVNPVKAQLEAVE